MKRIMAICLGALCIQSSAQNHEDILRYSNRGVFGSARTMGMAGSFGAIGADLGAASVNPAGLGMFRSNQFLMSASITSNLTDARFAGVDMTDSRTHFNVPNIGVAFNSTSYKLGKPQTKGLVSGTFVIGLNRLNDFSENYQFNGLVRNSTVGDNLARQANGINFNTLNESFLDNFLAAQAWRVALIDSLPGKDEYLSLPQLYNDTAYTTSQFLQMKNRGRMQEWYVGGGVNISNVLFLGATMVIQDVTFTSNSIYREQLVEKSVADNPYKSVTINQSIETSGSGIGAKFGAIFRPVHFLRIGAAYHTPVRISLTDNYQNSLSMTYANGSTYTAPQTLRKDFYEYQLVTPGRLQANLGVVIGKKLILSADYERVDYTKGRLQATNDLADFISANNNNKLLHTVAENIRAGFEYSFEYIRLRGGYATFGSPYNEIFISKEDGRRHLVSGGLGWVYDKTMFFDFAVSSLLQTAYKTPYGGNPETALLNSNKLHFSLSAAFKF